MSRRPRTLWEQGRDPGAQVAALATAVTLSAVLIELQISSEVAWFTDVVFVAACIAAALLVRMQDFFTVGVMPPLLLVGVFSLLAITTHETIAHPQDGFVQAVVAGLSSHSLALVLGYGLSLGVLAVRHRVQVQGKPLISPRSATGRPHHGG